jgi:hypothetical protein
MRLYIKTISHGNNHDTYAWTSAIEGAWHWNTKEEAISKCRVIEQGGITVKSPIEFGKSGLCADFRVEPRPQGGFAASCEHPLC